MRICSEGDCAPTLLLLLHSWGSGMQQLWFDEDLSPLLSLPPDVNVLFATSLNGASDITRHMHSRLASLQHTGSIFDWLYVAPFPLSFLSHFVQVQLGGCRFEERCTHRRHRHVNP